MYSIFDKEIFHSLKVRLKMLTPETQPNWGRMSVSQMLYHCHKPFEIPLGLKELKSPSFFMKVAMKLFKSSMYNDKPWRKSMPTPKEFKVTNERDFEAGRDQLLVLMTNFYNKGVTYNWPKHPAFGEFTAEQWGKMEYKHLDHHFMQFGV